MTFVNKKDYDSLDLVEPYKSYRHIAMFSKFEKAKNLARILNFSLYLPIGLTVEEIDKLVETNRSKYCVKTFNDNFEVLERLTITVEKC